MDEGQRPLPRGRGAMIAAILKKQKEEQEQQLSRSEVPSAAPRGRAALLDSLRKQMVSTVGAKPSTSAERHSPEGLSTERRPAPVAEPDISKLSIKDEPLIYSGEAGQRVNGLANYVPLRVQPNRGVFEYEVKFLPDVDSKAARIKMVSQIISPLCNARSFDGHCLYLPEKIIEDRKIFNEKHPHSDDSIAVTIIFKKQKKMSECIHLYNVLFKRIMYMLKFLRFGRQFYDQKGAFMVPNYPLEIWPGYVTAVSEYNGGVMLCLDVSHRVLRTQNVLELIMEARLGNKQNFRTHLTDMIIGSSVLTRYNNKTYMIADIMWDSSPKSSFPLSDGTTITFIEYYSRHYGITINDHQQPMLVTRQTLTESRENKDRVTLLVPELCFLTGLTEDMRSDFVIMKSVADHTRVSPFDRVQSLRKFINNVNSTKEVADILSVWGLTLDRDAVDLHMRVLDAEQIIFGNEVRVQGSSNADWSSAASKNYVLDAVNFRSWLLVCTTRDRRNAEEFVKHLMTIAPRTGIKVTHPDLVVLPDDRTESYSRLLTQKITPDLQLVVVICPTARDDRYSTIKRICCSRSPVASQVINSRTLRNPNRIVTIVQKILLQINCKLGGSLWTLRLPFKSWMICGIDVNHSRVKNKSVCALVSSLNETLSRWYSLCAYHGSEHEISEYLRPLFVKALQAYREARGAFPGTVVIFRDGVGDGDMNTVKNYEIQQFLQVLKGFDPDIKLTYIIVQKRVNAKIFLQSQKGIGNPTPGSIVDHTITKRNFYDFYLVSQNVRHGTVTPTHYTMLFDNAIVKPDNVQRLTFKMCHLYYNWTGTIRVPAPCQYAHKLAFLVGESVGATPSEALAKSLFYL